MSDKPPAPAIVTTVTSPNGSNSAIDMVSGSGGSRASSSDGATTPPPVTPLPAYSHPLPSLTSQLPPSAGSSLPSPGAVVTNQTPPQLQPNGSGSPNTVTTANGAHTEPTTRSVSASLMTIHQPSSAAAAAPQLTVHYNTTTNPANHMTDPRLTGQPPLPVGPPPLPTMNGLPASGMD